MYIIMVSLGLLLLMSIFIIIRLSKLLKSKCAEIIMLQGLYNHEVRKNSGLTVD